MLRSMRSGYRTGFFLAGVLAGVCLTLAVFLLSLPSFWWRVAAAVLLTALFAGALWLLVRRQATEVRPEVQRAAGERIAESLDKLVAAVRDSAALQEPLRELAAAIAALSDRSAQARPVSPPSPSAHREGGPPRRADSAATVEPVNEQPRRDDRPARSGDDVTARLVRAWTRYFDEGDGRFTAAGLQWVLEQEGLGRARALPGDHFGAGDDVVAVTFDDGGEIFFLPSFSTSVHALSNRFEIGKGMARDANVRRLVRPAVGRGGRAGFEIVAKGAVE